MVDRMVAPYPIYHSIHTCYFVKSFPLISVVDFLTGTLIYYYLLPLFLNLKTWQEFKVTQRTRDVSSVGVSDGVFSDCPLQSINAGLVGFGSNNNREDAVWGS